MNAVVYLHGFASGPRSAKAHYFAARLAELGVPLRVPDLAQGDFEHLTITGQLEAVDKVVAAGPATLIGSSMGGYVAALYAARHPQVNRLILLAPAFGLSGRWASVLGEERSREWERSGWLNVYHFGEGRERRLSFALCEEGRRHEEYPDFQQPALIFHGRNDTVVPLENSVRFARGRANVKLHPLESDHELLDVLPEIWSLSSEFLDPAQATR
ncbi:MAG: alpha/beta fold hydrolase [Acidobacteriota bacterium]|nr:alpha/beta fold hydrolase [Acidobacteriota bacterium]